MAEFVFQIVVLVIATIDSDATIHQVVTHMQGSET